MTSGVKDENEPVQWFVMNAYKSEKKAEDALESAVGIEYFIPKRYVVRKFQGKLKRILVPVIPNLVFVKARYGEIEDFKIKCPYLHYATCKECGVNKIMKVPDAQMENFMKVAGHYEEDIIYYSPDELDFKKGMKVRVLGGAFEGVEGVLLKVKGKRKKRVVIEVKGLLALSAAEIETDLIEVLKD